MGGSQSTRKLTISNDDPSNVIRVSDSVVQRFRGERTDAVSLGGGQSSNQSGSEGGSGNEKVHYAGGVNPGAGLPPMPPNYIENPMAPLPHTAPPSNLPPLTSLQIRQEKEVELRANDAHWQRRINQLEESHQKISEIMEREYSAAMGEMRDTFLVGGKDSSAVGDVCADGKRAVLDCYRANGHTPMLCAPHVQAFADCVDKHRMSAVINRG